MKPTPYNEFVNTAYQTQYPVPVIHPKYPDYYILDIGDIVHWFVQQWDHIVTAEVMEHPIDSNVVFPEVYTIAEDGSIQKKVYQAQHVSERGRAWHPDISLILRAALEAIKAKHETQNDMEIALGLLWVDVAYMADVQIRSNVGEHYTDRAISNVRKQIANLSMQFGKKLYQRLIEYGMYKHGHFPYHYAGWQDDCAIVALDDETPDPQRGLDFITE